MKSRIHAYNDEIQEFVKLISLLLVEQNLLHLPAPKTPQTKNVSVSRVRRSLSNIVRFDNVIHATARASDYGQRTYINHPRIVSLNSLHDYYLCSCLFE